MPGFTPTRSRSEAEQRLAGLLRAPDPHRFDSHLRRLRRFFHSYATTCPLPQIAGRLAVTPELRCQSELYLPIGKIAAAFELFYQESLAYAPLHSSTPFRHALSWADLYAGLPPRFQSSANPARLLAQLLDDHRLRLEFLCHSFLPDRFYGGFRRYPAQREYLRDWLHERQGRQLRCLDAACGTGEESYALALLLLEQGWPPGRFRIEGRTIEPLEVWAASCAVFPHDFRREEAFRRQISAIFESGIGHCLEFSCADLLQPPAHSAATAFDLIVCNGLLGGPILNDRRQLEALLQNLTGQLAHGGMLLAADSFHGGWKQKHPQAELRALMEMFGLKVTVAGEGLAALRH